MPILSNLALCYKKLNQNAKALKFFDLVRLINISIERPSKKTHPHFIYSERPISYSTSMKWMLP